MNSSPQAGTARTADSYTDSGAPSVEEVVKLGAVNSEYFCKQFFPTTARQKSPPFHKDIWALLEGRDRLVNIQVFRDGAKTTLLRMYTAKRIAYGLSRTILYLGKSEGHAIRSIKWLLRAVEYNTQFARTFNLRKGKKWQDTEAQIIQRLPGPDGKPIDTTIWIMGMGITGSVRGINQDDWRPDLIVVDDVIDEENSATPDGRRKLKDLLYGAVEGSLAPASESPDAKMVMLQTPLNKEDASTLALKDQEWKSAVFGCWTDETMDSPLNQQVSRWEERWPSETFRQKKRDAIARNELSVFLRERECRITSPETSSFKAGWLKFYELEPEHCTVVIAIDPVPPPSEVEIAKGLRGKDYEAFAVIGRHRGDFYLLAYELNRGHDPSWTTATFFSLALKWKPRKVIVEAVAYQRTLAWILRKAMTEQRRYFVIEEYVDKRKKYDRIVDSLNGTASMGHLFVKKEHSEFIEQFTAYPDVAHDDLLEAVAVAVADLSGRAMGDGDDKDDEAEYARLIQDEKSIPHLVYDRGAP